MANVSTAAYPLNGLGAFVRNAVEALRHRMATQATFARTYRELAQLSDRDLADLGIHRSQIRSIAREAADQSI